MRHRKITNHLSLLGVFVFGTLVSRVLYAQDSDVVSITVNSDDSSAGHGRKQHPSRVIVRFQNEPSFLPNSKSNHQISDTGIYVVENPPGLSVADAVRHYKEDPNVLYVEPDYEVSTTADPTDPLWSQQWDMVKIAAPQAWDQQTSASDVIVAVIDTGVDLNHPDLQANLWTNPADGSHGFTCLNGTCTFGGQDDYGHGTHVAGTIGAVANDGMGIAGINWRTQILSCKFLDSTGSGNVSDAVLCFNQILALKQQGFNIRVTNNSWGGGGFSQALKDVMQAVEAAGIVNVCAAGNNGVNADTAPMYPGAYNNRGIVSVLASDQNDLGAYFTNYGIANVDIAAPGVSTLSTVPSGSCPLCDPSGYRPLSGTSMATPHVSGVLAAIFHANSRLSAYEARDAILDPASYDVVADQLGGMTSTGGRLNLLKALTNPILSNPKLNNFPTITGAANVFANAGDMVSLTAIASDPDNDPTRIEWSKGATLPWLLGSVANSIFPPATGGSVSFRAPSVATAILAPYSVSVSDSRGGSSSAGAYATIVPGSSGQPPSGTLNVSPLSGPVGTVVTVNFSPVDAGGSPAIWDVWSTTGGTSSGRCCFSGPSTNITFSSPGVYRVTAQAVDHALNFSNRPTTVVRIGGASGTPPIANASFDTLTGTAPLTVNIDMTASTDPDGTIQNYLVVCDFDQIRYGAPGPRSSCVYDTPGTYWMLLQVKDNSGLLDVVSAYVTVTPPGGPSSGTKQSATVTLSNLNTTYTGAALAPTATTNPPGLPIIWTNAPQTNAGTYAVTATINDPSYQGSASGTLTIAKAAATISLSNLNGTYTGAPLAPTATTNPPGLAVGWTNAPQTNAGTYAATATINDPNYQGSVSGTFTIAKAAATLTLSDMTQTYTGNALKPAAATSPAGLAIGWTNAPQTAVGSYPVAATVNDPNYTGSTSGTFTITPATPVTPPAVSITNPQAGVVRTGSLTIQAVATAGTNPIARVDFLVNGNIKCSDTSAPYSCSWNMPGATGKNYDLQAKAYDTAGNSSASSIVKITSSR